MRDTSNQKRTDAVAPRLSQLLDVFFFNGSMKPQPSVLSRVVDGEVSTVIPSLLHSGQWPAMQSQCFSLSAS